MPMACQRAYSLTDEPIEFHEQPCGREHPEYGRRPAAHVHDAWDSDTLDEAAVQVPVHYGPRIDRARLRQRPQEVRAPAERDARDLRDACACAKALVNAQHLQRVSHMEVAGSMPGSSGGAFCIQFAVSTASIYKSLAPALKVDCYWTAGPARTLDSLQLADDRHQQRHLRLRGVHLPEPPPLLGQPVPALHNEQHLRKRDR